MSLALKCPICNSNSQYVNTLSSRFLKEEYESFLKSCSTSIINFVEIQEYVCMNCELGFSNPMLPGSDRFYHWISSSPYYYPSDRWEWGVLEDIFSKQIGSTLRAIDIGCGNGDFLSRISKISKISFEGIDTNQLAILRAQKRGLNTTCETVQERKQRLAENQLFDVVTSFHCLEHVSDPLEFVRDAISLLKPMGSFFFSLPLTPSSLEITNFTVLNHAPHHLTRWTQVSLKTLASELSLPIKFYFPNKQRSRFLATYALAYKFLTFDELFLINKWKFLIFKHPFVFWKYWQTYRRLVSQDKYPWDVVLCEIVNTNLSN